MYQVPRQALVLAVKGQSGSYSEQLRAQGQGNFPGQQKAEGLSVISSWCVLLSGTCYAPSSMAEARMRKDGLKPYHQGFQESNAYF